MILTGKCIKDFEKWYIKKDVSDDEFYNIWEEWSNLSTSCKNAFYIDFFDSVGIYILISPSDNPNNWFYTILGEDILSPFYQMYQSLDDFENRQEATEQAIKKANEIYNEKFAQ